ncbi:hypothetical protein GCM10007036_15170 [Alsobacter metallidurans]|uniref:DUF2059 domain-containing protein n=1 Tax=Alsobacter metallidurans TaxID=340221 RepID=A0A917I692_9HYPH|nr:DUF2059 domain-containing protein [Alsobacter metallidurans]GGH15276.1 hypothetical protein GCM10007036_15170 [Alsobacter metallidurans]
MSFTAAFNPRSALAAAAIALALSTAPALAQQPAATHLAVAREVVVASGLSRSFEAMVPQFMEQMKSSLLTTRPEITKDLNEVLAKLKPEFESQREDILNAAARTFAGRMSEPELKDVAAFYKSASGQKYVSVQPQVMDDLFGQMQAWSQRLSEFMIGRVRAEMKTRGVQL